MQKDRPLFPGVIEGTSKLLDIRHYPEPPLRVRMREGINADCLGSSDLRLAAGCQLQQRFRRLARQMVDQIKQTAFA
jgi:hypothetical protein